LFVCLLCVFGLPLLFRRGAPLLSPCCCGFCGSLFACVLFVGGPVSPSGPSSWWSCWLPPCVGVFGAFSCGVFLCLLLFLSLFLRFLLRVPCRLSLGSVWRFRRFLSLLPLRLFPCRLCLRWLGVLLLCLTAWVGSLLLARFLFGCLVLLLLLFVGLLRLLVRRSLLWLPSSVLLFVRVRSVASVFVVLGLAVSGFVLLRLFEAFSFCSLPSGWGWWRSASASISS